MSDAINNDGQVQSAGTDTTSVEQLAQNLQALPAPEAAADSLDAVEDIDFLLEEIENKIAPLALA